MELRVGLAGHLEVRLLGDAPARQGRAELVVHDLDLLVDQHVGQVHRRVGDCVLDDLVGELMASSVDRVVLEPLLDVGAQRIKVGVVAHRAGEVVIEFGLDLLAQLLDVDREVSGLAREALLDVVLREGDVELRRIADAQALEVVLEARDEPILADDEGHPVGAAALEGLTLARTDEADHRVIALLRPPVLDRREGGVLVAQLVDDLVDLGLVDRLDLGPEVEVPVVTELDLGPDLDVRLEDQRLAFLGLDHLDVGLGERQDLLLDQGLSKRLVDQVLDRLVEHHARPELTLEHMAGCLARAESGDAIAAREPSDRIVDGPGESFGRELDLEDEGALRSRGAGDLHGPGSIC